MIVNSIDYAAALSFGLYASDLQADAPPANYAQVILGSEDRGLVAFLAWANPTTYSGGSSHHFSLNTWYHIVMEYDAAVHTLKADVTVRDTGEHFATLSATNVGPFATDMGCLGSSNVRSGNFQCPGHQSFGKFDNIILSQPPTPAGSIVAWGDNSYGQCNQPPGGPNTGFVEVVAGCWHSLGLKQDGSIVAWGDNSYGQCNQPPGGPNTGFVKVAAIDVHSLGLKQNGSIVVWGSNLYGEGIQPPNTPNTGFVDIAAGEWHNLGLKSDGSIVAWGRNYENQCDVPPPNTGFVSIAAGNYHSLGLKSDGSIVAWGYNEGSQLNIPSPNSNFIAIDGGYLHSLGLKNDGSIVAWGSNYFNFPDGNYAGQCNVPLPNTGFVKVAAGLFHSLGLKMDGSIVGWGDNSYGQATPPPGNNYIAISAGYRHSLAIIEPGAKPQNVYHVDAVNGNDNNNGLSRRTAFATIAKGIDSSTNRYKVLVYPGVYQEEVDFKGKAITIQGVATKAGIPVIENPGDFAVSIYGGEGPRAILKNFVIRNSFMAIFIAGNSPTIKNLTVVDNKYGIEAYAGSEPDISNCIFWNNIDSELFGCEARYSCTSQSGQGNIDADPCFVDPNNSDYHLLSQRGRYWPRADVWVLDKVTSPCIDGGDPNDDVLDEPMPNGGRIDMGAFGGTPFASMSEIKWLDGDISHDGVVNLIDLAMLAENWLRTGIGLELPANYNWLSYNGHHYALTLQYGTWEQSEAEAVAVGGHLVTINNQVENYWAVETINNIYTQDGLHPIAWIGLEYAGGDRSNPNSWRWVNGEPVTYWNPYSYGLCDVGNHMYLEGPSSIDPGGWNCNADHETYPDMFPRGIIELAW
jgi:parallel beta-helix repeat protein